MSIRPRPRPVPGRDRPGRTARRTALGAFAGALLLGPGLLLGCGDEATPDPLDGRRMLVIDAASTTRLLERSARLEGTPMARVSRDLLARVGDCETLWLDLGPTPTDAPGTLAPAELREALDCGPAAETLDGAGSAPSRTADDPVGRRALLAARRGEHAGLLVWPVRPDGRLELAIDVDAAGGLLLEGWLRPPSQPGPLALLIPGTAAPAPSVLDASATLAHLRLRPAAGLDLASLAPTGGQADRLFGLRSRLLEGALLSGTWELAFLAPGPEAGDTPPRAVIALHHRMAAPIERAVAELLARLEQTWPIRHAPHALPAADGTSHRGGCFESLPLLPDLAPCWVVTDRALVLAYDADALARALGAPPLAAGPEPPPTPDLAAGPGPRPTPDLAAGPGPPPTPHVAAPPPLSARSEALAHGLEVHLDRFARVDHVRLGNGRGPGPGDLYERLDVRVAAAEDGRIALRLRLEARP